MHTDSLTRLRGTVFLVSLVTIIVELALMRELALRFWEHLAWLIISIALLGFGVSGTMLLLLQRFSQLMAMPGSEIVASRSGPHGLVQIIQAPAFHGAPGLSLTNTRPVPDQLLVTLDGHLAGTHYRSIAVEDFAFLDNTTMALAYQLLATPTRVLVGPEAGADQLGLALYHGAERITVLTDNSSLASLKKNEMASRTGDLYGRPEVTLLTATLRGYLYNSESSYSLIELPTTGEDFGGLRSATTNPLLTLDTFRKCFDRLDEDGVLSITTHAHVPPRESLRLVNMFVDLLEGSGRDPRSHLTMIRSWATVTLAAAKSEITPGQAARIRSFTEARSFDLVWLPDIESAEVNRHHVLDDPQYYLGAMKLLGAQKSRFASDYIYDLTSPQDGKPFFHHFSRGLAIQDFSDQLGKRSRSFTEIGKILLIGALVQTFVLALLLIVLPLLPVVGIPGGKSEQLLVIGFFSAIGCGFMLLEMGFLQRLEVYLGHPLYAAAAVLSGFLFFGGLGSILSSRVKAPLSRRHCAIGLVIAVSAVVYLMLLDAFLAVTEGAHLPARLAIVMVVVGPLALMMGMMFPLGMKRLGYGQSRMIPWAWSVNGFTSVLATLLAPLLAMHWGFATVGWSAAVCYGLAALFSLGLPNR